MKILRRLLHARCRQRRRQAYAAGYAKGRAHGYQKRVSEEARQEDIVRLGLFTEQQWRDFLALRETRDARR